MIFAWNFLKFTRFFEGLQKPPPSIQKKGPSRTAKFASDQKKNNAKFSFACSPAKIQLKDIPALVCKKYIFWLEHASIPFKGKVRNLWIFFLCASFPFYQTFMSFKVSMMRTFFFLPRLRMHIASSFGSAWTSCEYRVESVRGNWFSNSCTISVQEELPATNIVGNQIISLAILIYRNGSRHRRIMYRRIRLLADEFCVKILVHVDAKKGKISVDDDVCNTKVGDNYPGARSHSWDNFIFHCTEQSDPSYQLTWRSKKCFEWVTLRGFDNVWRGFDELQGWWKWKHSMCQGT